MPLLPIEVVDRIKDYKAQIEHREKMKWVLYGILSVGETRMYDTGINRPMRRESYFWMIIEDYESLFDEEVCVVHAVEHANESTKRVAALLDPRAAKTMTYASNTVVKRYMRLYGF
jgi:hypothetical protein